MILYPADRSGTGRIDAAFGREYEAAVSTGLFSVALFNYDQWLSGNTLELYGAPDVAMTAVYRGWMLKPERYRALYDELKGMGIELVTNPTCYEKLHLFPNVYDEIQVDTARTVIIPDGEEINIGRIRTQFDRFMVKDYVKSVKGTDFPGFFDATVTQETFDEQMKTFYKYRGTRYIGGICIKEYLELKRYDRNTNEYRVFYMNHEMGTVSRNSLQGNYTPQPPKEMLARYAQLGSPFYTVDYAELKDGSWKIIEVGDGGVSGLSDGQNAEGFYRTLYHAFSGL